MKKFLFIILSVLLLPAALPAQQVFLGREGKIMAMGDCLSQALKQKVNNYARSNDMKAVATAQTKKASNALNALLKAYPEYAEQISAVIFSHDNLVKTAAQTEDTKDVLDDLTVQMSFLNNDISFLQKANKDVAEQVRQIVKHDYWLSCKNEAVSLDKLKTLLSQRQEQGPASAKKTFEWLASK